MKHARKVLWINKGLVCLCQAADVFNFLYCFDLGLHTVLLLGIAASVTFSDVYFENTKYTSVTCEKLKVDSTKTSYFRNTEYFEIGY